MLYLILLICALSLGAEAQICNCSIGNLPQCLFLNTTDTTNMTMTDPDPLLCVVIDLYNLVDQTTGGTVTNILAIVFYTLLVLLKLVSYIGYPVSDLIDRIVDLLHGCVPENSGLGTYIQSLADRLIGAVASILRLVLDLIKRITSIIRG